MKSAEAQRTAAKENTKEERVRRIIAAAFEVFSESSFGEATTGEIARRAHVSKRDIYAHFPDKHSLLIVVMNMVLQAEENKIIDSFNLTRHVSSLRKKLETIGLAIVGEVLSPQMSVIARHVTAESINRPLIGTVYFENGPARRSKLISELLSAHLTGPAKRKVDPVQAGEHYMALVAHQPRLTTLIGMQDVWDPPSVQLYVASAVDCFFRAYPAFT